MNNRIFAGMLVFSLVVLFLGTALGQEENSSTDSQIAISNANFVAPSPEKENLNGEWVEVSNNGTADANLTGWTLEDAQNHTYTFPDFSLKAGAKVVIHTGVGTDTSADLFWNRNSSVWNNDGDLATLMDVSGNIVARYPEESQKA
jgi:micrococcal nuclease